MVRPRPERHRLAVSSAIALASLGACRRHEPTSSASGEQHVSEPSLVRAIPMARAPITIDGEWNDPDWNHNTLRVVFVGKDGKDARPYSEVRFVHDANNVYLALYASDTDIVSADTFEVSIGSLKFRVNPRGTIAPAIAGVRDGTDLDGTLDHPGDNDEEWKIEMSIPLTSCGLAAGAKVPVHLGRCDTPREGYRACGAWDGTIELATIR